MARIYSNQLNVAALHWKWYIRFALLIGSAGWFITYSLTDVPHPADLIISPFGSFADTTKHDSAHTPLRSFFPSLNDTSQVDSGFPEDSLETSKDSINIVQDSLHARNDTSGVADSTRWVVCLDSTARIEQFVHRRSDEPAVAMFPQSNYSLYLNVNSPAYKRELQIDSTGRFVTVREMVNGLYVKVPVTMTLEDYVKARFIEEKRNNWQTFTHEYRTKERGDELAGLLGSLTNIEIPVPANPLFSIFGGKGINLRITGAVDIRGAFRRTTSDQVTVSQFDQARNEPDFNQDVQINVNGTIGDKLNILADWNTQRTFEYENQLKIKYTGYDDEIVQSVEAGNVSLQTPSLIGGGQALFGIKAKLQTGPLTLTTLLSQKKGQTKEFTVSGGAQQSTTVIQPQQYSKSYFFIDTLYRKFYEVLTQSTTPTISMDIQRNYVVDIDVWVSRSSGIINPNERQVNAYIELPHRLAGERYTSEEESTFTRAIGKYEVGRFLKLDQSQFKVNRYAGYIVLNTNVGDDQAIAVAYRIQGDDPARSDDDLYYGEFSGTDTSIIKPLVLKLVKPKNLQPNNKPAWDLMLKNVYPLGGRDLKREGFELKLYIGAPGKTEQDALYGANLLQVLGLDRFDQNNAPSPDNTFDFIPSLTVDMERAEIIFPTLRPFDTTIAQYFRKKDPPITVPDSLKFGDVYDTTQTAAANNTVKNNYFMRVKSSTAQSSRYNLGFNIVEGSVSVLLNGVPLQPNIDYTIDYIIGEVVIRNPQALVPNANVQVKYEQNDLFQLASKTLIGARGELALSPTTNLGFTLMNLNQATLSDKVRLGEEPTNNMILGVDGSTSMNLPFLTSAIDALPLLRTKEMSSVRISGEAAYMIPDPNTKKSTITSDKGASIAYIDDFEGARRTIPFSINYSSWHLSSLPVYSLLGNVTADSTKAYSKAKMVWYNKLPSDVSIHEIWPNRNVRAGQDAVTVLNLDYDPNRRGPYNFSPNLDSTLHRKTSLGFNSSERRKNWAGIMRYISTTGGNIIEQNINYLEIWMKASSADIEDMHHGKLYVDLGRISEDVIPNNKLNSEDLVVNSIPNGVLNPGEDVGLDMLPDDKEKTAYSSFLNSPGNVNDPDIDQSDPSGDDWSFSVGGTDFSHINGTENNQPAAEGRLPDTEDLNGNGDVDLTNTYLEYEIPLDSVYVTDSLNRKVKNNLIVGGGINKWYQFRIPLLQATRVIPAGTDQTEQTILQNVQYIRLWLSGFEEPVSVRIAEINLVGNQWQELTKNDSTLKVSVVNIEDNPNYAKDPTPGVVREKDRTQPDQVIEGNEQSLALQIKDLRRNDSRQAVKYFVRPLDLFNYKSMKMFVHGDPSFDYIAPNYYDAEILIRFGADTLNFYEYRQPIHPGWDPLNEVNINFSELTSVKAARDSLSKLYRVPVKNGPPGATYGVQGNPSLTQIKYIGIGVANPSIQGRKSTAITGEVWVNELRLVDVDNSSGVAYRFDTQIKLADFGTFGFNYSKTDPNFHGLDQRFGSRVTNVSWAMNTGVALERFFPQDWQGTSIPFGYSHAENISKPKYLPNTDILVEEAANRAAEREGQPVSSSGAANELLTESQSLHVQDSYSVSNFRIAPPSQAWYIRDTFSKLTLGFNYSTSSDRNPSIADQTAWLWNFKINYGVNLPTDYYFQPFKSLFNGIFLLDDFKEWKFYYIPITNFSTGLNAQRSRTYVVTRSAGSIPRDTRNFAASKSFGFGWKLTEGGLINCAGDYSLSVDRTLLHLDNDSAGRGFGSILKSIFFGGKDSRYGQRVNVSSKPKIPNVLDIPRYFDLSASYGVSYNWQTTFQQGDIGKSAGFDNSITIGSNLHLKELTDPWFQSKNEAAAPNLNAPDEQAKNKGTKKETQTQDSASAKDTKSDKSTVGGNVKNLFGVIKILSKIFLKVPFLDYENINITFNQANRAANSGVVGTTGFLNFWGRLPFQGSVIENGPSRLYQLGIISDPSGTLKYSPHSGFPFVGWETERGLRAPLAQLTDQYNQTNTITLRTNRPLWEGASFELNWKVGWQFSKTTTFRTDELGQPTPGSITTGGSVERSFLSLPPVLFFKVFKSNLEDVGKKYDQLKNGRPPDVALAEAFEKGLEALPFLNKFLGQYSPRVNWTLRWDGLEKIAGLSSVVQRMSLEHSYSSSFKRDFRGNADGSERTDVERVTYGFSPLASVNVTFKDFLKGSFSGNFRYNTTTTYDLNLSVQNIVATIAQEFSLSLTYSRKGFQFPLFGVNLSNDVDVTLTYSLTKNSRRTHDPNTLTSNQEGTPLEGNTRTTMEPRIRYMLSSRVTAALFYRYSKIAPDEGGSLVPGTATNEAGVDIHIAIQ